MRREVEYKKLLLLLLTIVLLEVRNVAYGDATSQECNGTSIIGDCLPDVDEFLMESETNAMLFTVVKRTSLRALQKPPICKEKIYGNCIGNPKNPAQRPCNYDNRCKRGNKRN